MTDASQSMVIGEFEHVAVGSSVVLVRVSGRSSRPRPDLDWRPALVARAEADALERAARELTEAAAQARSRD